MAVTYALEPNLSVSEFVHILKSSGLGAQRPIHDLPHLERVLRGSDIVVVARNDSGGIVGIARCITDFAACCYCADLGVAESVKRQGIGRRPLKEVRHAAPEVMTLHLFAAEDAVGFYNALGFRGSGNAMTIAPQKLD
ncbi:GNAT family N-acetyltransferase [Pelagibacterium xiamenense]|uniref:GNAT family N-acetyltransferase n=1 Tax=Pelagibacterium xiamenense TaxID=2901140 RepID=UPI001E571227|nr:GNAT family N-acetyltransferase [Pelagibacterium xiamenense]MCD7059957.1 GNAT family N-acetyltransferase [Pelagibacterium xiamenense]